MTDPIQWIFYVSGIVVWCIAALKLIFSKKCKKQRTCTALAVVVIGPPLFYPLMYFVFSMACWYPCSARSFTKLVAEMWGPFWVAVSALAVFWHEKSVDSELRNNELVKFKEALQDFVREN